MDHCQEDSQHGLLPLPGGGESVGGGVRETDHRGGPHLQEAPEGKGSLQGVRGGDGGGISGESHDDSAWAVGRGATELDNPGHRGRATDIYNGLPRQGRPGELPGGGMPGPRGDKDGDAGALPAPAYPRHHGSSGGGKSPPLTVHPMRHAGPPSVK